MAAPPRNVLRASPRPPGSLVLALAAAWARCSRCARSTPRTPPSSAWTRAQLPQAASIARIAHDRNPLAVDPLFQLAAIEQARGNHARRGARSSRRSSLEPANPETWRRLGRLRLTAFDDPKGALRAFQYAYYLDPKSPRSVADIVATASAVAAAAA